MWTEQRTAVCVPARTCHSLASSASRSTEGRLGDRCHSEAHPRPGLGLCLLPGRGSCPCSLLESRARCSALPEGREPEGQRPGLREALQTRRGGLGRSFFLRAHFH